MRILSLALISLAVMWFGSPATAGTPSEHAYVTQQPGRGDMELASPDRLASLYVDPEDHWGVLRAVGDLQEDFERVTTRLPDLVHTPESLAARAVIVGTLGKSSLVDRLVAEGRIDVAAIRDRWEAFHIELIDAPLQGVGQALVIAGSDRRGTIFGVYELSARIGVSPWYWWADVPPKTSEVLYVRAGTRVQDWPRVRYRGIFLNDEAPALTGWVQERFGDYNHEFYARVFELLLRLKGNFLWPAMWNNAFADDDPLNAPLAHQYGIVMGTSHHEPMMRADKEWDRHGEGPWDYARNPERLYEFWKSGAERNRPYESIYTLGMRGQQDTPMSETQDIELLERIVADQREILANVFDDRAIEEVPQVWALYKEVQGYYESGMRVPDDVTLLWSDDNWGNIRRLPAPEERNRPGGAGVYYHFDYVGGPRSYRWINTIQLAKIWEQMNLAHAYGADRIWIVNVGDLKPMEYPISFFLDLAWDIEDWPKERIPEYARTFAEHAFGTEHAETIAALLEGYTRHNARRKPELQDKDTYSLLHYREAERIEAELEEMTAEGEALYEAMPEPYRSAFFQLVLYPVKASAAITRMYIAQARNHLYATQGRATTNHWADTTRELFDLNAELAALYHGEATGGKWNHMMSQPRIGYTHWNNPPADSLPPVMVNQPAAVADMGVAVEGMAEAWPQEGVDYALPEFHRYGRQQRRIEVFNKGSVPFDFTASAEQTWIRLDRTAGTVRTVERLTVSIDWERAPSGEVRGEVFVRGTGWGGARIAVTAFKPAQRRLGGWIEADGHVSIPATGFARTRSVDGLDWQDITGLGRTGSSMAVFPVTDRSFSTHPTGAPYVEYDLTLFSTGEVAIHTLWSPTLPIMPDRGLRFGIAVDEEPVRVIDLYADRAHHLWQESVRSGVRRAESVHTIDSPGHHRLRIYGVDPGVTLQNIVIDTGGLVPSYLGPPPSTHATELGGSK